METKGAKVAEPAVGIPYAYPPVGVGAGAGGHVAQQYYVGANPYQSGMVPPNAIYGDPKGIPLQQTMFHDTPAPFSCVYCGSSGLSTVRSKPSLAAFVACTMPLFMGICFLCPSMDCLWHKYHYCPSCGQQVAEFKKSDPCLVADPVNWTQASFALPA
ncbi:GSH-induced LITAF domain protein [Rhynchospora pubera]|uniref:GSH-induced LITAF domain protein n=1 Tax=Rhynchospora pubera TaxID=906938 RepID=A0AAV8HBD0_9POAL|nr:GSH-induced LITAF domain protein [Rhynchospora pubera]KAJ4814709.1 GSH-induced LITAF domain protein [Rhynchospora pubera]